MSLSMGVLCWDVVLPVRTLKLFWGLAHAPDVAEGTCLVFLVPQVVSELKVVLTLV